MSVIPELGREEPKEQKFNVFLGSVETVRPAWNT